VTNNPLMLADGHFHEWLDEPPQPSELAPPPVPATPPMFLSQFEQGRRP
jgi:hypothetical protein